MGKDLKTSVRLDTKSAVKSLDALERKINRINTAVNKTNSRNSGLTRQLQTIDRHAQSAERTTNRHAQAVNKLNNNYKKTGNTVSVLASKLKRLAATYLGVMGAKAAITTSDVITSTENRLNNLNGGDTQATQNSMDKMYVSSQKVRMGYADMMSNVSKSITLAGDAFQNNIDNAIRFQEIMAEAYTLGGASAAEMSSSMYQMIQALGSGILQGDELRSVREGAPLAYKEIEKFAQGVFNTEESLKELASQGRITSDLVVAAIMSAGDKMDEQFKKTSMTFAQAWTNIKNTAIKSFEPVLQMLNDALNSEVGQGILNGLMISIQIVAGALRILFGWISNIYNFIVDNWTVISKILMIIGAAIAIILFPKFIAWIGYILWVAYYYTYLATIAVISAIKTAMAWLATNWVLALIIVVLIAIVATLIWVSDSFTDACGIIMGVVYATGAFIYNILAWIGNVAVGLWESLKAIATNIGIAFQNGWNAAKSAFWNFVADCLDGLKMLEPAINAVAKAFGAEGFSLSGIASNARSRASSYEQKSYVSVGDAWSSGYNTIDYKNLTEAYNKGYGVGEQGGQWITDKLGNLTNSIKNGLGIGSLPSGSEYDVGGVYDPNAALKDLGSIDDNTGKMADSMDLAEEDLSYLRKIAALEWKKEFTTANITVDMNNYNTVNGDGDLDGIVTKLVDKLYEELDSVANGVYA